MALKVPLHAPNTTHQNSHKRKKWNTSLQENTDLDGL